ncbi:winged helix-turn-helix transcriptional regulator [Ideonella paludis]
MFKFKQTNKSTFAAKPPLQWSSAHLLKETRRRVARLEHPFIMNSRQAKLQEDTSFRVLRLLQDNPDITQRELASKLGISVGG